MQVNHKERWPVWNRGAYNLPVQLWIYLVNLQMYLFMNMTVS